MTRSIRVVPTPSDIAGEALAEVLRIEARAIAARGCFRIALSGGSTVVPVLDGLARREGEGASFARWHVYFADERMVPADHASGNYRLAEDHLLSKVAIPRSQIHRVRTDLGEPARVAQDYAATLQGMPAFDLVIMGMGPDGHTGSLFPGAPILREEQLSVADTWTEKAGDHRIAVTPPLFRAAGCVLYLVGGGSKAEAVANALHGRGPADLSPARFLEPVRGEFVWILDQAAAAQVG